MFYRLLVISLLPTTLFAYQATINGAHNSNPQYLPEDFVIYTDGEGVSVTSKPDFHEVHVPTRNIFKVTPGCYIACHSDHAGIYQAKDGSYVHGQYRVYGHYLQSACVPQGVHHTQVKSSQTYIELCNNIFSTCDGQCWPDGDTGQWFS